MSQTPHRDKLINNNDIAMKSKMTKTMAISSVYKTCTVREHKFSFKLAKLACNSLSQTHDRTQISPQIRKTEIRSSKFASISGHYNG
jgi:hypothetical protein